MYVAEVEVAMRESVVQGTTLFFERGLGGSDTGSVSLGVPFVWLVWFVVPAF